MPHNDLVVLNNYRTKLVVFLAIVGGTLLSMIESADAARRPRGPVVVVVDSGTVVSHN